MTDYFGYNDRKTRKAVPVPPEPEPAPAVEPVIEVQEDPLSETGIIRFLRRVAGRTP